MSTNQNQKPQLFQRIETNAAFPSMVAYMTDEEAEYGEGDNRIVCFIPELVEPRKEFMRQVTPEQIVKVEVADTYEDDHEICVDMHIHFSSGDVLSVGAQCIIPEFYAQIVQWNNWQSKNAIIDYLIYDVLTPEERVQRQKDSKPNDGKTQEDLVEVLVNHYAGMEHNVLVSIVEEYIGNMSEGELRSRIKGEGLDVNGNDVEEEMQLPIQDYVFDQSDIDKSSPKAAIEELFEHQTIVSINFNEDFTNYEGNIEYDANITFNNGSVLHAIGYHGMWEMSTFNDLTNTAKKDFQYAYLDNILWYYDNN